MLFLGLSCEEDKTFLVQLYRAYYPLLKHTAYAITQDFHQADDLVQDAFIKLIDYIDTLKSLDDKAQVAYCVRTVQTVCFTYCKKKRNWMKKLHQLHCHASQKSSDDLLDESIIKLEVQAMFSKLCARDRDLLVLKYFMGYDNKQIKKIMGIDQVSVYLKRAKEHALAEMKKRGVL